MSNEEIASYLDTRREVVSVCRKRFFVDRLAGLEEHARPGRPLLFPPELVVQIKALACELPAKHGLPLSRWSIGDLVPQVQQSGLVASISGSSLWRWLHEDAIRPWYHRSWVFPRDPEFARMAGGVLDLYARQWQGSALKDDEFVSLPMKRPAFRLADASIHPELPPAHSHAELESVLAAYIEARQQESPPC